MNIKQTHAVIILLTGLAGGGGCQHSQPDSGLLGANLMGAALRTLQGQQATIALSGRLRAGGGLPLQQARVTLAPTNGGAAWSCTTDSNGFWNLDMSVVGGAMSFTATVEKDSKKIAVLLIEIGIVAGDRTRVQVSTSILSGDVDAEVEGYVRSSLLVSGNPPLLLEGSSVTIRLKFNQSQSDERTVSIKSSDATLLTIDGLPETSLLIKPADATTDHSVLIEALADADLASQTASLIIHTDGLPDALVTFVIQDADVPTMIVVGAPAVSEDNSSAVLLVRPGFVPDGPITFAVSSEDATRLAVAPGSLTFTPADYLTPQPITVTGLPDSDFTTDDVAVLFSAPELAQPVRHSMSVTDTTPLFAVPVAAGSVPGTAAALCDLDGDGAADAVSAGGGAALLRVLPNASAAGSVALGAETQHALTAAGALGLRCADLDGDGHRDVVVVHRSAALLEVLRHTGAPGVSLSPGLTIAVGSGPVDSLLVDLDGDGRPDVVTADRDANRLSILKNTSAPGSLSFAPSTLDTAARPAFLASGDFNGDGRADLVVVHDFSSASSITIFPNTSSPGTVSFGAPTVVSGLAGFGLFVADLNGDGRSEILTITDSGTRIRILTSAAATPFSFSISQLDSGMDGIPAPFFIQPLLATDLDGDGLPEVVLVNPLGATAAVFRNLGSLTFTARHEFLSGTSMMGAHAANLDGSGRNDLALFGADGSWLALRNLLP